jgi:FlaA1/EpsC-like NDP-sugar epimerase
VGAFALAYLLRFDFEMSRERVITAVGQLPLVLLVQGSVLYFSGAQAFVWRYVGMTEAHTFVRAWAVATAVLLAARLGVPDSFGSLRVPLSIILMDGILAFGGVLGVRFLRRSLAESIKSRERRKGRGPALRPAVLLVGAGSAGIMAAREIHSRGDMDLEVKGFIDDDPLKRGAVISGIRVLGTCDDLPRLVPEHQIDHVILTIADAPRDKIRRILEICAAVPVRAQTIPALYDVLQGKVEISRFRNVRVEDLLERDIVTFDQGSVKEFLSRKTVMVTGAGGSIGSELSRQVARHAPTRLLLVERAEFALFQIDHELRATHPDLELVPLLADISDRERMRALFSAFRPQVVAHAAAHKHVTLMEHNAGEAVKNNVFGTRTIGELAGEHGAEAFVMISTDKAVRPSSVMGATKRVAELVVQDLGRRYTTRYVAVRFGNVLGSTGSVVPIFREQIAQGGPVTITHPEMKRYFMTIPEATVLVLEAGAMGEGGEIFILDMGEPVRILDMAKRMIELSGHEPFKDIQIVFTGARPGEKLFEELETTDEAIAKTRHPKIYIGRIAARSSEEIGAALRELHTLCETGASPREIRAFLAAFLPESEMNVAVPGLLEPA